MQEKARLLAHFVLVAGLSVGVTQIVYTNMSDPQEVIERDGAAPALPLSENQGSSLRLEVLPADGQPRPLGTPLQGSGGNSTQPQSDDAGLQMQEGDLQQQGNGLQPSATTDQLPDDFNF